MRAPRPYTVSKFLGEYLVVDQTGELENVGAGDRKSGEVHGGHSALPPSRIVRGAPPEVPSLHRRRRDRAAVEASRVAQTA